MELRTARQAMHTATRPLAIAVAQTQPVAGAVEANVAEHLRLAAMAAAEGAEVVVFPELSLTGYELAAAGELAFSAADPRLAPLLELASARAVRLVVGAPVRCGAKLHIGAFILSSDGSCKLYTKRHLGVFPGDASPDGAVPPPESAFFHPGRRDPLIPCGGGTAALAVCADVGRPSHPRRAAARGATSYLASMFVIPSDFEIEAMRLRTYAERHGMVTALANFGGPSGGLAAAGRSAIWSETGELIVQLEERGAAVAVAARKESGWHSVVRR